MRDRTRQPDRERIESFDEHPQGHFPGGSVIRRTDLFQLLLLAQDWAREKLEKSPRHGEWVEVKHGDRNVRCFLVFPEMKEKADAVIVVHEIFGLTEWVRSVADQLAEAGYIAIAPDLLSGQTYSGVDEARKAISQLSDPQVMGDLKPGGIVRSCRRF